MATRAEPIRLPVDNAEIHPENAIINCGSTARLGRPAEVVVHLLDLRLVLEHIAGRDGQMGERGEPRERIGQQLGAAKLCPAQALRRLGAQRFVHPTLDALAEVAHPVAQIAWKRRALELKLELIFAMFWLTGQRQAQRTREEQVDDQLVEFEVEGLDESQHLGQRAEPEQGMPVQGRSAAQLASGRRGNINLLIS
jgi:hypothetical protein